MFYDDGFSLNGSMRVVACPMCNNEQFSGHAQFCMICGFPVHNACTGREGHRNPGNARFCETCGAETLFSTKGLLQPYEEVREKYVEEFVKFQPEAAFNGGVMVVG